MTASRTALRPAADRAAIGLSLLCAVHCIVLPIAIAVSPALAALGIQNDSFHQWMIVGVLPISAFALLVGWAKHRRFRILAMGVLGLLILGLTDSLGSDTLGVIGEMSVTLVGVVLVTVSHLSNYRTCKNLDDCIGPDPAEGLPGAAKA